MESLIKTIMLTT